MEHFKEQMMAIAENDEEREIVQQILDEALKDEE